MESESRIVQIEKTKPGLSGKRKKQRSVVFACTLIAASVLFFYLWKISGPELMTIREYTVAEALSGDLVSSTEASGTVILPIQVDIVSPEDGFADLVNVKEGDSITGSDILAVLYAPDLNDERDELQVELEQSLIELESLELEYNYSIRSITRNIERLEADIVRAEEEAAVMGELAELKSSRKTDYEDSLDTLEELNEEKEDLEAELEETRLKKDIDTRKQNAAVERIRVNLRNILKDIDSLSVRSPIEGEVLSINESLFIPGASIETTDVLFVVADRSEAYIDFDVYEQYSGMLEEGGKMTVSAGTSTFQAEIVNIGKIATMDSDGLSAMVTVRAKPLTDQSLTPGASAVAAITLGIKHNAVLLPRGAYLTTGNQQWVYKVEDNRAVKTKAVFGEIQGNNVEIIEGVNPGDHVIVSGYQDYLDQDAVELKQEET